MSLYFTHLTTAHQTLLSAELHWEKIYIVMCLVHYAR
jgi:hypothetical protein